VHEWCHDYYQENYYQQSRTNDPRGPFFGSLRVERGGSWHSPSRLTHSAFRNRDDAGYRDYRVGFRVVRELD
ncbi:MAG TPA: formylglycine-generating enzyme family protein, partial [Myxococcales bacterium]|nr:formylglycine-generating enzyme family protein [Myxococcales bacterium]